MLRCATIDWRLSGVVALAAVFGLGAGRARADLIPGGGSPKSDCYVEFDVTGGTSNKITCMDGDPSCDTDGQCQGMCTFSVKLCVNQTNVSGCTPSAFKKPPKVSGGSVTPPSVTGNEAACGTPSSIEVNVKKRGKKTKPGKKRVTVRATVTGKPKQDKDILFLTCTPRPADSPCPPPPTTTTTAPQTCTTATATTSTTLAIPTGSLSFTTTPGSANCGGAGLSPAASMPFSGHLFSDVAMTTPITGGDLGLGCLYIGGGHATSVPPDLIPDGATNYLAVSGTALSASPGQGTATCTQGVAATSSCIAVSTPTNGGLACVGMACTSDTQCDPARPGSCAPDAKCYFGPPLPIPNGGLSTCVLNVIKSDASGTVDTATGDSSVMLPLFSRVYLTGNGTQPCPKCVNNACDRGLNQGGFCIPVGTIGTAIECPPQPFQFLAPLTVDLSPLTSTSASKTAADGNFCPMQSTNGNAGAFGQATAKAIKETGTAAGNLTDMMPHGSVLASIFCIPATGNIAIDLAADLPGPGAIGLNGNTQLH